MLKCFSVDSMAKGVKKSAEVETDAVSLSKALSIAISGCATEEDLRFNIEHELRNALDLPPGKYEESIKTSTFAGHADAVHQGVVIEYKKPRKMRAKAERKSALEQLEDYLSVTALGEYARHRKSEEITTAVSDTAYSLEEEERLSSVVGIATDGERFIFVQRRGKTWNHDERKLNADTVEKLGLWLQAMQRKDLSPENLLADFGPQSQHARDVVRALAMLVHSGAHPKANVIYKEWRQIFGIVYGTKSLQKSQKSKETQTLSGAYQLHIGV